VNACFIKFLKAKYDLNSNKIIRRDKQQNEKK